MSLSGIDKMKKPELIEKLEELGIDPSKTVADMKYQLRKALEGGSDNDDSEKDSPPPKKKKKTSKKGTFEEVDGGGDIASPEGTGKRLLVHCVAKGLRWSKRGTMGRLATAYGKELIATFDAKTHTHKLGAVQFHPVKKNTIASAVCLAKPSAGSAPPFDSAAFDVALEDSIKERALKDSSSVHIDIDPRTPKLLYSEVKDAIEEHLINSGIDVYVYKRGAGVSGKSTSTLVKRDSTSSAESEAKTKKQPAKKKKRAETESDSSDSEDAKQQQKKKKTKKDTVIPDGSDKEERRKHITAMVSKKTLADYPLEESSVKLVSVDRDTEEFWDLEERFNAHLQGRNEDYVGKRIKDGKKPIRFILIAAERVENITLEARFEIMKKDLIASRGVKETRERVSFHGTHPKNCNSICKTSLLRFKHSLNPCKTQSDDGWFGTNTKGVYVSRYADYTLKYANRLSPLRPDETAKTILFRTLPGKSKHIPKIQTGMDPTPGFDSHSSPDFLEWYLFDEAQLCPEYVLQVRAEEDTRTKADDGMA